MDEGDIVEAVLSDITDSDVFYDVGANVGLYTCFISQKSKQTIAFEPHPENAVRLRENVTLNEIRNLEIRDEALSDTNGDAELAVTGVDVAGEGTHSLATGSEDKTVEIQTVRADSLPTEVPEPDVVKIDVEGAEMSVLRGMGDLIDSCRVVYCETHAKKLNQRCESHEDVVNLLSESGFSVEELESRGEETFLRAMK
jgi:FkbM family methyltransferase